MNICIIGGGISGLYAGHLLEKKGHNVTIFEPNKWGGEIQTVDIEGNCYPISTLFVMNNDRLLKQELKNNNINSYPVLDVNMSPIIITMGSSLLLGGVVSYYKGSIFPLIIILIIILIYINNIYCITGLSFGAYDKCPTIAIEYIDINLLKSVYNNTHITIPEKCGFKRFIHMLTTNKNINYVNKKVTRIDRARKLIYTDNKVTNTFDKIIIACGYNHYKDIIELTKKEAILLSDIEYFTFYTTIAKYKNDTIKNDTIKNDVINKVKLDDKVYIYASHVPLKKNVNSIFQKTFKWIMPNVKIDKSHINGKYNDVFFIGMEIKGNGVNTCMELALGISKYF